MTTSEHRPRPGGTASLARLGFVDPDRARTWLTDGSLAAHAEWLAPALGEAADPDAAVLGLVRIVEAHQDPATLLDDLRADEGMRRRLIAVLGSSAALVDHLARRPGDCALLGPAAEHQPGP
ncbi:MAG: bifunctional glutamine-synthetase adenylyltransferase/deadenyltransferase, partial [Actinomycetota bacterium]|nr:bifunctional glutamine-synthetase adenylyltransferase/deadenyltransferase [Actinomycetota bacterium]